MVWENCPTPSLPVIFDSVGSLASALPSGLGDGPRCFGIATWRRNFKSQHLWPNFSSERADPLWNLMTCRQQRSASMNLTIAIELTWQGFLDPRYFLMVRWRFKEIWVHKWLHLHSYSGRSLSSSDFSEFRRSSSRLFWKMFQNSEFFGFLINWIKF